MRLPGAGRFTWFDSVTLAAMVAAGLIPLLSVGACFAVAGSWHLTQVEGLVGFPLFLVVWLTCVDAQAQRSNELRLFCSGLCGGNPVYHYLSGRAHAVALNGYTLELLLREQWTLLVEQLTHASPVCVFIDAEFSDLMAERSPRASRFIADHYRELRRSHAGTWYIASERVSD